MFLSLSVWAPGLRQLSFYLPTSKLILKRRFALLQNSESLILSGTMGWSFWKCISDTGRTCIRKAHPPLGRRLGTLKEDIVFAWLTRSRGPPTQGHTSKSRLWLLIIMASFPRTPPICVSLRWESPLRQQKEPNFGIRHIRNGILSSGWQLMVTVI